MRFKLDCSWVRSDWAIVLFLGCLAYLLFFNSGTSTLIVGPNWHHDDGCYLQYLGMYIGMDGSDICQAPGHKYFARGAPILWIIPGLLGKWIAHFRSESPTAWIIAMVANASFFLWV